jgi:hypothetical protein
VAGLHAAKVSIDIKLKRNINRGIGYLLNQLTLAFGNLLILISPVENQNIIIPGSLKIFII